MSERNLKPCPFCGGEAELGGPYFAPDTLGGRWVVNVKHKTPHCPMFGVHPKSLIREILVMKWNTRAEVPEE